MFRATKDVQMSIEDRFLFANDQAKKSVDSSRAKLVGDIIYPNIDESKFAPLFSEKGSRPNCPIRQYVSLLVLKRMYGLSDEVMIEFLRCGALNFQYALHTTQDDTQPLSESSIRRFRRRVEAYNDEHNCDLIKEEYMRISEKMAIDMGILGDDPNRGDSDEDPIIVRMDSMEIECHAKAMGRIEIIYTTIIIVIRYLLKNGFGGIIPKELHHYLEEGDKNRVIYHRHNEDKKSGNKDTRLEDTVSEMLLLQKTMADNFSQGLLSGICEYQTFLRVLEDQTVETEDGGRIPRNSKDISPSSVQNPFDTSATYRFKRGRHHGFVLNAAEAVDGKGNGIIIDADLEQNTCPDNKMAEAYMERQPDNGRKQVLVADGTFRSDRIDELSGQKNIDVKNTSMTGARTYDIDADFKLNGDKTGIDSCPCGEIPVSNRFNPKSGKITAKMPDNCCASCPHKDECNVYFNEKKGECEIHLTAKMVGRAEETREILTDGGKSNAKIRNGVEGIMSVMRRKYGVDRLPVFGIERLKQWIWTSLLSYNLVKYQKWMNLKKQEILA